MKIILANYKEGVRVPVHEDYDPKKLDLEFVDLKYQKGLALDGTVEKSHDVVLFEGHLTGEIEQICGRCLQAVRGPVDQPFELCYEIKGCEEIDTLDDLREVLIINHPMTFLCKKDCLGICPQCGVNRNETRCQCKEQKKAGNAFGALKNIWLKSKEGRKHG
jgi:uncharacterized protein